MRDLLLMLIVFGMLPSCYFNPRIGLLMWSWISYMLPHRMTWSYAYDFRFNMVIAAVTLPGIFFSNNIRVRIPWTPVTKLWVLLIIWMSISALLALNPSLAAQEWNRTMKIQIMVLITILLLDSKAWFDALAWVIALSVGFYGVKGGLFTFLTGGAHRVYGPVGGFYYDNNTLALALVTTFPLFWYLYTQARSLLVKLGLVVLMGSTILSVFGTYSRGGMLGSAALATIFWLKSPHRFRVVLVLAVVTPSLLNFMPEHWHDRMNTMRGAYALQLEEAELRRQAESILLEGEELFSPVKRRTIKTFDIDNKMTTFTDKDYQINVWGLKANKDDRSVYGRVNSWGFAINLARDRPFFGGGFSVFTRTNFHRYAPDPGETHDAHSIYFEVLAEQGVAGFIIWFLFYLSAFHTAHKIGRYAVAHPELDLAWARELSAMLMSGLVGYAACGVFLGMAYFDLPYHYVGMLVALRQLVEKKIMDGPEELPPPKSDEEEKPPFQSIFDAPSPQSPNPGG